jgi:hypothetical protein
MAGTLTIPGSVGGEREYLGLLRAVVRRDPDALERGLSAPELDPGAFMRFLQRHRLLGYVYLTLGQLRLAGLLPAAVREGAKRSYSRQFVKNEQHATELARLLVRLEREGMQVLTLKGLPLAQRFYGDLSARSIADLDLLLRRQEDLERVERLLLGAGYVPMFGTLLGRRLSMRFTHHFAYRKARIAVEVHWVLHRHPSVRIDHERLWRESACMDLRGVACRAASAEYEMVMQVLSLHADLQVGKLALKPFVDLYQILKACPDTLNWDAFFRRRRQEGVGASSAFFLSLLLQMLDCGADFPRLADHLRHVRFSPGELAVGWDAVLRSDARDPRHKLVGLRLYDTSPAAALGWWALSLPFRLAVYR